MAPFWDLKGNDTVNPQVHFLGTTNNRPLIIKTNTDGAPNNLEEVLRVTPSSASGRGRVGIGTTNPQRRLHVEDTEIHSGGSIAGFSFGNRETPQFVDGPGAGERWVWYATGGRARLWSGNDKLMVTPAGEVGIGTANPQRRLHVENTEIHSGGSVAGFSFGNRETPQFVDGPGAGERWVWYASGGRARLWSGNDKVTVTTGGTLTAGTLTAATKNFRINHPLDPEHRLLIHACLEGPENAVYYRGQGRLEGGLARVELPDYFEVLVRPEGRTVILTSCCEENEPISVLAASGIVNGAFNVRAADDRNPRQLFYWEVKAVRADVKPLETEEHKAEGRSTTARGLASVGSAGS